MNDVNKVMNSFFEAKIYRNDLSYGVSISAFFKTEREAKKYCKNIIEKEISTKYRIIKQSFYNN